MSFGGRLRGPLFAVCRYGVVEHPVAWLLAVAGLFGYVSRLPVNGWNVEILIARNLLRGQGFVVGPLDPPALWRPPLAVLALLPIEALVEDPTLIYAVFSTLCLCATAAAMFYLMKRIGGVPAAHYSQLLLLATPAFVSSVSEQMQLMSYLLMFATVAVALHATIAAWSRHSRARDAWAGVAWGLAYLARPEMSVLFAATLVCSVVVYRRQQAGAVPWRRLATHAACFAVIYLGTTATFRHQQRAHGLLGQVPLVTYYAGEYFASSTMAEDRDGAGYAASVERYGDPADYGYSLVRFAVAHPDAVATRLGQNLHNAAALFSGSTVLRWRDWLAFLAFGSILMLSTPPPVAGWHLLLYGVLLTGASSYFLLFHMDPRYALASVLMLTFTMQVAAVLVWRAAARWVDGRWRHLVIAGGTAALATVCASRVYDVVATTPPGLDVAPFRELASRVRQQVGSEGTPAVGFWPMVDSDGMFWISYFANTSIPWVVDTALFPRDKVYSFTNRAEQFSLVPATFDLTTIGSPAVLWRGQVPRRGEYLLVARELDSQ